MNCCKCNKEISSLESHAMSEDKDYNGKDINSVELYCCNECYNLWEQQYKLLSGNWSYDDANGFDTWEQLFFYKFLKRKFKFKPKKPPVEPFIFR